MIQRQQSLWLLLSTIASILSFEFPFYTGSKMISNIAAYRELEGGSEFPLLLLTIISVLISAIAIFLYKDRKTQLKLSVGGIVLSILLIILYISYARKFLLGNLAFYAIFVVAIPVGYVMAARAIWKDEKLVKSLDKLR